MFTLIHCVKIDCKFVFTNRFSFLGFAWIDPAQDAMPFVLLYCENYSQSFLEIHIMALLTLTYDGRKASKQRHYFMVPPINEISIIGQIGLGHYNVIREHWYSLSASRAGSLQGDHCDIRMQGRTKDETRAWQALCKHLHRLNSHVVRSAGRWHCNDNVYTSQ